MSNIQQHLNFIASICGFILNRPKILTATQALMRIHSDVRIILLNGIFLGESFTSSLNCAKCWQNQMFIEPQKGSLAGELQLILVLFSSFALGEQTEEISGGLLISEYYVSSLMNYLCLEACQLNRSHYLFLEEFVVLHTHFTLSINLNEVCLCKCSSK